MKKLFILVFFIVSIFAKRKTSVRVVDTDIDFENSDTWGIC